MDKELLDAISVMMDAKLDARDIALDAKLSARDAAFDAKLDARDIALDAKLADFRQQVARDTVTLMDAKLAEAETRIVKSTVALMDAEFRPQFGFIVDELSLIKEKLADHDTLESMQSELDLHHTMLKKHTQEIAALKKAN